MPTRKVTVPTSLVPRAGRQADRQAGGQRNLTQPDKDNEKGTNHTRDTARLPRGQVKSSPAATPRADVTSCGGGRLLGRVGPVLRAFGQRRKREGGWGGEAAGRAAMVGLKRGAAGGLKGSQVEQLSRAPLDQPYG